MKATVIYHGDPTVGIFDGHYDLEIPEFDDLYREEIREKIKELYSYIDEDWPVDVRFEDDVFEDDKL